MQFNFVILSLIVILSFSLIHAIEVTSFISRLTGVMVGKRSLAYSLQNAVFMLTRFFIMALMPILGLIVDIGVNQVKYLTMVFSSLLGASVASIIVILVRGKIILAFKSVIEDAIARKSLIISLVKFPIYFLNKGNLQVKLPNCSKIIRTKIFWFSAIVFCIYSISTFIVFYLGLIFPDYRTSISQLSGIMNAFATVLLTFWIEPRISLEIDKESNVNKSTDMILTLLIGRIFGVAVISTCIILSIYLYENF